MSQYLAPLLFITLILGVSHAFAADKAPPSKGKPALLEYALKKMNIKSIRASRAKNEQEKIAKAPVQTREQFKAEEAEAAHNRRASVSKPHEMSSHEMSSKDMEAAIQAHERKMAAAKAAAPKPKAPIGERVRAVLGIKPKVTLTRTPLGHRLNRR